MPIKKHILYPFFLKIAMDSKSEFWRNVYENLAYGITLENCYIQNNHLCYNRDSEILSVKLDKNDISIEEKITKLINEENILTENEKNLMKIDIYVTSYMENNYDNKWFNIKKKNIKDILIEKFVINNKKKYNLSIKQAKILLSFLVIALIFKAITHNDINYSNNNINDISGITFNNQSFSLFHNLFDNVGNLIVCDECEMKTMKSYWFKYIDTMKKKCMI